MNVHTGYFWGEKSLTAVLSPTRYRRGPRSSLTSYATKTCLGPCQQKPHGPSILGWIAALLLRRSSYFFCCLSLQTPISLVSAAVLLICCFLVTSSWLDTVVWLIFEFLLGSHFTFSCSIPRPSVFQSLKKIADFQAEGVMSGGVR